MLLEFQLTNFRSFRATQTLSMVASKIGEHIGENTFDPKLRGFDRLVRSAAVYGANAAGKTNLILGLQFMQAFILQSASGPPTAHPPYSPFKLSQTARSEPTEFRVAFVQDGVRYEYGFSSDSKRVRNEWLMEYINPRGRAIFERTYVHHTRDYRWAFSSHLKGQRKLWSESTRPNALFLSTAANLNSKQLLSVFEWFQKRLVVVAGPSLLNPTLTIQMLDKPEGRKQVLPFLREADLGISDVNVTREPIPANSPVLVSGGIIEHTPDGQARSLLKVSFSHADDKGKPVTFFPGEESAGTRALFSAAGAWLNVFSNGEVIAIDESLDTSLHPLLARYLISRFHSDKTNSKNAQLIFSTHNTSLLTQDLFRRDQIWFVEKDKTGSSSLYPLTDFKVRSGEALQRGYLAGRYGALPVLQSKPGF
jgi:uncharacterized protein